MQSPDFIIQYMKRTAPFTMQHYHHHDIYEIYYLLSGERYYFIKDRTYHLKKGDLVFIPANMLHKTAWRDHPEHERILIHFKTDFLTDGNMDEIEELLAPFSVEAQILRLAPLDQIQIEDWLQQMCDDRKTRPFTALLQRSLLIQLLIYANFSLQAKRKTLIAYAPAQHQRIYEIIDYMNEHFASTIRLHSIAAQFQLSSAHLSRTFKQVTSFTFVEYLNAVRIQQAQEMLLNTSTKVIDIAAKAGFENLAHFGRVFKEIAGMTPSQYRKYKKRTSIQNGT